MSSPRASSRARRPSFPKRSATLLVGRRAKAPRVPRPRRSRLAISLVAWASEPELGSKRSDRKRCQEFGQGGGREDRLLSALAHASGQARPSTRGEEGSEAVGAAAIRIRGPVPCAQRGERRSAPRRRGRQGRRPRRRPPPRIRTQRRRRFPPSAAGPSPDLSGTSWIGRMSLRAATMAEASQEACPDRPPPLRPP